MLVCFSMQNLPRNTQDESPVKAGMNGKGMPSIMPQGHAFIGVLRGLRNKNLLFLIGALLAVGGVLWVHVMTKKEFPPNGGGDAAISVGSANSSTTPPETAPVVTQLPVLPGYQGRPLGEIRGEDLSSFPQQIVEKRRQELKELVNEVNKNPSNIDAWIQIGIVKKFFNDYIGARDAWEYASLIDSDNSLISANLGNLYTLYLKDYPKAESSFRRAVVTDPQESYFLAFADLYKTHWPEKEVKAIEIMQEAIAKLGNRVNFYLFLANYYESKGNKDEAIKNYQEALRLEPENSGVKQALARLSK